MREVYALKLRHGFTVAQSFVADPRLEDDTGSDNRSGKASSAYLIKTHDPVRTFPPKHTFNLEAVRIFFFVYGLHH